MADKENEPCQWLNVEKGCTKPEKPEPKHTCQAYHWRQGIHFRREQDGSVTMFKKHQPSDGPTIAQLNPGEEQLDWAIFNIPAKEWASIIAAVSYDGIQKQGKHEQAVRFHDGDG